MVADKFVGRGGQLLLLERRPFCPARDCQRCCDQMSCGCKPCSCSSCRARRRRKPSATPDLIRRFNPAPYQPPLFGRSTP